MATLTELYNKISTAEDFAKSSPIERAAIVTNKYDQMVSPQYGQNTDQVLHAVTDSGNVYDPAISAGSAFVNAVGSLPVIDNIAKPLAEGINSLHSDSYEAHQVAKQAHRDVFDRKNQSQYYSDLANGKSSTMASLAKVGREAMDYFSNSNGQDLITDIYSGAGSLAGSFALGGFFGKAVGAVYTGIKAAKLASTVEGRLAGYQSALTQAQNVRAQLMTKLSDAGITNTEKEALATELGNLNKVIAEASTEQQALIQQANLARNNLAAAEHQRDLYSSTSPLKNESLLERKFNNSTLLSDEALAKNVNYNKQNVAEATDALRANKAVLDSSKTKANTIQEYLNQEGKIQSSEKGIDKLNKFQKNKLAQIKKEAQEISPELGGLATNFTFGLSEGKEALSELDNLTVEDFKANATEQAKREFNSLVKDNLADGMSQEKAEAKALDSLKFKAKATNMISTGLAEAAISKLFGTAKLEGLGLKKGLAGGLLRTATNTLKETGEELGQTYAENSFGNRAIQYFNRDKDTTENLGRDLAQTAISIPGGMATVKAGNIAKKAGTDLVKGAYTVGSALAGAHTQNNIAEALKADSTKKVKLPSDLEGRVIYSKNKEARDIITDTVAKYELDLKAGNADRDVSFITKIKEGIKDHKDVIDTRNSILDEINHQTGIMKATTTSEEDKKVAALNVVDLVKLAKGLNEIITNEGDKPSKNIQAFKKEYNKRLAEKIKDLELDKDIIPVLKDNMLKEASQLNLPKDQAEGLINQHLDTVKSDLSVASMLLNSDTSKEDVQALADMAQELTKMNPSYAKLPEAQVLNSKIELAKAYSSWLKKSNGNFQTIYDNTPDSTGKTSKHVEGFYGKNSFKQYMTIVSDILNDANLDDKDTLASLGELHKNLQEFYSSQESKIKQVTKVLEDIESNNLQGYKINNNVLHYESTSKDTYTTPFKLNISLTGKNENGAYTPEVTRAKYLNPIQREQEIMIAIGSAVKGLKEALEGKPVSLEPKGKANTQGNDTGTGNNDADAKIRAARQANGNAAKALADSFTKRDEGRYQGKPISSLTYNGPAEIPYTYTIDKDTPPVHLQVKKNFYPFTEDGKFPKGDNSDTDTNGKYLQFAFKFASTYAIEDEQERLKAQEKLLKEAKNTGLLNKLTKRANAPRYENFFTKESLQKARIPASQSVGFIGTNPNGSYQKVTLFTGKKSGKSFNEVNYKFDFAEHIYSGILKERKAGKQIVSEPVSTDNNQNKVNTEETKAVESESRNEDTVANTTITNTATANTEPTVTEEQLREDLPSDSKKAVVILNTINKGSFTFKDSNSEATNEVVKMILDFFNENSEVAHVVAQAVNNIATNILNELNDKLQFNLGALTAEEFNSNGLFRFFTFEENNDQIIAKWATINGESVEGRVKAALALTLLSTAFTRDKRLNQLVEEFTENNPDTAIFTKDLSVKLNNKIDINWNQAMKELKDTPLVSLNSFGSVLSNYLRALIPATADGRLTPSGGKYAHDTLTGTIINMFKRDYWVKGQSVAPIKGEEGNIHYFTIFYKGADKIEALGQVIALPNLSVKDREKTSYRKSLKVANEDLAKLEGMPVDMHVGTEPLESLGTNNKLRHTKLKTSKAEAKALKNLSEIPHEVTTYGNFVSKVSQSAYVEAMLPSTEYISEEASSAQRAKAEQLVRAHTEVVDTKNLVEDTQKGTDKPVYIYYGNDYTKVHRLNASHYDSYRNNKTVREGIAPSKMQVAMDTLRQNAKAFMLWKRAVVQGFGDKVQNITDISPIFEKYLNLLQQLPENQQKALVDVFLNNRPTQPARSRRQPITTPECRRSTPRRS